MSGGRNADGISDTYFMSEPTLAPIDEFSVEARREAMAECHSCNGTFAESMLRFQLCAGCIMNTRRPGNRFFYSLEDTIGKDPSNTYNIIPNKRAFGVELESSSISISDSSMTRFSSVRDGSIEGQEFVSPILYGDMGAEAIRDLCNYQHIVNSRCGFHVHLDARNLSWWDVVMIGRGYTMIQPIIFQMMPPSRRTNRHCQPITTPYFTMQEKENVLQTLYSYEARSRRKRKYIDKRYEFLNAHSYFYHRTLEIRCHEGTFDYQSIINWVNFNQCLFDYFTKNKTEPNDNPYLILRKALPDNLVDYVRNRLMGHGKRETLAMFDDPGIFKDTAPIISTPLKLPSIHAKRIQFYPREDYLSHFELVEENGELRKRSTDDSLACLLPSGVRSLWQGIGDGTWKLYLLDVENTVLVEQSMNIDDLDHESFIAFGVSFHSLNSDAQARVIESAKNKFLEATVRANADNIRLYMADRRLRSSFRMTHARLENIESLVEGPF